MKKDSLKVLKDIFLTDPQDYQESIVINIKGEESNLGHNGFEIHTQTLEQKKHGLATKFIIKSTEFILEDEKR